MISIRHFQTTAGDRIKPATPLARLSLGAAVAMALVAGSAGVAQMAVASKPDKERAVSGKSVKGAEKAVERSPQDVSLRVALGHAYIDAGRFESAVQAFSDALTLGDSSASTVLSLALAQAAMGEGDRAVATLDQWREQIPASDMGLALSLAGRPDRGISVLEDAIRAGDNTAKARQNVAYSYALAGRWREARLMAMQDVPPQLIDQRISDWAMQAHPEAYRKRVASLLAVPLREDQGQPANLALNLPRAQPQLAQASAPSTPAGELPATTSATPLAAASEPDNFTEARPVAPVAAAAPNPEFQAAFAETVEVSQPQFVSNPIIQAIAPSYAEARPKLRTAGIARPEPRLGTGYSHLVQLGSFSSEARARQAWSIYTRQNPQLKNYRLTITPAVVRGRNYWRVAASGFDARSASSMCSAVKGRGGACFAYAATRTLPGAVPVRNASVSVRAPRMASR